MRFLPLLLLPLIGALDVRGVTVAHLHRRGSGYGSAAYVQQLAELNTLGANWIALNNFAYMRDIRRPGLRWGGDRTLTDADMRQAVRSAHDAGLKVLLKPHLWSNAFWRGQWHGDVAMSSEADWEAFFENYTAYLLAEARIAADTGADALCIGVEMEGTSHRSDDWRKLIAAVREVYDGPITYCAAFMEYRKIDWWDAVDVVGISAYFKLSDERLADEAELRRGWADVYDDLADFHAETGKPIAFLELGYTASETAAAEPWSYELDGEDIDYQARLYRVAIEECAKRDFMVGVFVWKWFSGGDHERLEGRDNFVVQNRPAVRAAIRDAWSNGE
ncbi:MAG: hypothetical protein AAF656_01130 [Planctomycetota bacterium]